MAKNELLPFANGEDANVLPTNQWEALTDILENGFQSGIARSEQVNRVLAQGAVASYVLGQLIVDQLNKNATLDKDTLYQNLVSALQENAKDACLPLAGGTMTGTITSSSETPLKAKTNSMRMHILGSTAWDKGAHLVLSGKDSESNGSFELVANNGTNSAKLVGDPNGWLNWNNHDVITSAGGNLTGDLTFKNVGFVFGISDTGYKYVCMQGGHGNSGAFLAFSENSPNAKRGFKCRARGVNGEIFDLDGRDDGTLLWRGQEVQNPVGAVIALATNSAPNGYLLCNGAAVSRTTYATLFARIGTTYGAGDGSTTFNVPDLRGRFIEGAASVGTVMNAGLPNIWGTSTGIYQPSAPNNAFYTGAAIGVDTGSGSTYNRGQYEIFDASKYNSIYGNSNTVQPPAIMMKYYIKY